MRRLSQELQASADKKIRKQVSVQEFYHFYLYLKELIPVMKHLSKKYAMTKEYIGVDNDETFRKMVEEQNSKVSAESKVESVAGERVSCAPDGLGDKER